MSMRTRLVYGLLIAVWGLIVAWQAVEHDRIKNSAQEALRNRSRDITTTLAGVSLKRVGVRVAVTVIVSCVFGTGS